MVLRGLTYLVVRLHKAIERYSRPCDLDLRRGFARPRLFPLRGLVDCLLQARGIRLASGALVCQLGFGILLGGRDRCGLLGSQCLFALLGRSLLFGQLLLEVALQRRQLLGCFLLSRKLLGCLAPRGLRSGVRGA